MLCPLQATQSVCFGHGLLLIQHCCGKCSTGAPLDMTVSFDVLQAYEHAGDLERQSQQVVPLQSKLELAINERDAALAKAEGLTPRPGLRVFDGLTSEGCKKLGAAFDAHRYGRA